MNIAIMRAFVRLREVILAHKDLAEGLGRSELESAKHGRGIRTLFEVIQEFMSKPEPARPRSGFKPKT